MKTPKLPSHDERAEKYVLGTILLNSEESLPIAEEFGLEEFDFYLRCFLEGEREKPCAVLADLRKIQLRPRML